MGEEGLKKVATVCMQNMAYLKQRLAKAGIKVLFDSPNFHEVVIQTKTPIKTIINKLAEQKIIAGVDLSEHYPELGNVMSICVTETKTETGIDSYIDTLVASL